MLSQLTNNDNVLGKESQDVNELLFGKMKDYITFEFDDYKTKKGQESVFGPININTKDGTLKRALESHFSSAIDGYRSPNVKQIEHTLFLKLV